MGEKKKCDKAKFETDDLQWCDELNCPDRFTNFGNGACCKIEDDDDEKDNEEFEWDDD